MEENKPTPKGFEIQGCNAFSEFIPSKIENEDNMAEENKKLTIEETRSKQSEATQEGLKSLKEQATEKTISLEVDKDKHLDTSSYINKDNEALSETVNEDSIINIKL